jgi:hypothetical protein
VNDNGPEGSGRSRFAISCLRGHGDSREHGGNLHLGTGKGDRSQVITIDDSAWLPS